MGFALSLWYRYGQFKWEHLPNQWSGCGAVCSNYQLLNKCVSFLEVLACLQIFIKAGLIKYLWALDLAPWWAITKFYDFLSVLFPNKLSTANSFVKIFTKKIITDNHSTVDLVCLRKEV